MTCTSASHQGEELSCRPPFIYVDSYPPKISSLLGGPQFSLQEAEIRQWKVKCAREGVRLRSCQLAWLL